MAIADIELKVSVEATLHDAISTVLQEISDKHGVQVEDIDIVWQHFIDGKALIHDVRITSRKR